MKNRFRSLLLAAALLVPASGYAAVQCDPFQKQPGIYGDEPYAECELRSVVECLNEGNDYSFCGISDGTVKSGKISKQQLAGGALFSFPTNLLTKADEIAFTLNVNKPGFSQDCNGLKSDFLRQTPLSGLTSFICKGDSENAFTNYLTTYAGGSSPLVTTSGGYDYYTEHRVELNGRIGERHGAGEHTISYGDYKQTKITKRRLHNVYNERRMIPIDVSGITIFVPATVTLNYPWQNQVVTTTNGIGNFEAPMSVASNGSISFKCGEREVYKTPFFSNYPNGDIRTKTIELTSPPDIQALIDTCGTNPVTLQANKLDSYHTIDAEAASFKLSIRTQPDLITPWVKYANSLLLSSEKLIQARRTLRGARDSILDTNDKVNALIDQSAIALQDGATLFLLDQCDWYGEYCNEKVTKEMIIAFITSGETPIWWDDFIFFSEQFELYEAHSDVIAQLSIALDGSKEIAASVLDQLLQKNRASLDNAYQRIKVFLGWVNTLQIAIDGELKKLNQQVSVIEGEL